MTTISSFYNRLKRIGIDVEFIGNYPWIYLDKVNGIKVKGAYLADHGFTAFWSGTKKGDIPHITDISTVVNKIRETLIS